MPDRGEAFQGEDYPGVALSYGSLPCVPKGTLSQGQKPLVNPHLGGGASSISGCWLNTSYPARQTAILPDKLMMLWEKHAGQPGNSLHHQTHESYAIGCKLPASTDYSTLRILHKPSWDPGTSHGCPVPPSCVKAPGPRRVDMPPEEDWRQNSYTSQLGRRRMLPVHAMDETFSSASEAHRNTLASAAATPGTTQNNGWWDSIHSMCPNKLLCEQTIAVARAWITWRQQTLWINICASFVLKCSYTICGN